MLISPDAITNMVFEFIIPPTLEVIVTEYHTQTSANGAALGAPFYILSATNETIAKEIRSFADISQGLHDQLAEHIATHCTLHCTLSPSTALFSAPELRTYIPSPLDLPETLFAYLESFSITEPYLTHYARPEDPHNFSAVLRRMSITFTRKLGSAVWTIGKPVWETTRYPVLPFPKCLADESEEKINEMVLRKLEYVVKRVGSRPFDAELLYLAQECFIFNGGPEEESELVCYDKDSGWRSRQGSREAAARKYRIANWSTNNSTSNIITDNDTSESPTSGPISKTWLTQPEAIDLATSRLLSGDLPPLPPKPSAKALTYKRKCGTEMKRGLIKSDLDIRDISPESQDEEEDSEEEQAAMGMPPRRKRLSKKEREEKMEGLREKYLGWKRGSGEKAWSAFQ